MEIRATERLYTPHWHALSGEVIFDGSHTEIAKMENAGSEDSVCFAFAEHGSHVVEVSGTAACNDRDTYSFAHRTGEGDVVAGFGAVSIHAGEEDFSGAAAANFPGPFHGIKFRAVAAAVGVDLPCTIFVGAGINGHDDALAPKGVGTGVHERGILNGGRVHADLVGSRAKHGFDVLHSPDAAADGERHETALSGALDDVDHCGAAIAAGGDVKEDEFVRTLVVVGDSAFDGISGIAEFQKPGAFDDTTFIDVEAGNDAAGEHRRKLRGDLWKRERPGKEDAWVFAPYLSAAKALVAARKRSLAGRVSSVRLYSPMPLTSGKGNAVSALRIAGLLQKAGVDAQAVDVPPVEASVLVLLNAWRSAAVGLDFHRRHPDAPLVVVLTGTDIFPEFPSHPEVITALDAATAIVAWHSESAAQLPSHYRHKTRVIFKSAPDAPGELPVRSYPVEGRLTVLVAAHLREIKDPFRCAAAVELLPAESRIVIHHAGEALNAAMDQAAGEWMRRTPRWLWLGGIHRDSLWREMQGAFLTVNSSFAEGGANAVIESLVCGVPVLASDIPGNTGLLGRVWPGLYPPGDTAALAALFERCETSPSFYTELLDRTRTLAAQFRPDAEQQCWLDLLESIKSRDAVTFSGRTAEHSRADN